MAKLKLLTGRAVHIGGGEYDQQQPGDIVDVECEQECARMIAANIACPYEGDEKNIKPGRGRPRKRTKVETAAATPATENNAEDKQTETAATGETVQSVATGDDSQAESEPAAEQLQRNIG